MDNKKIIETLTAVYNSLDTVTVSGRKNMSVILGCMQALRELAEDVSAGDEATGNNA